MVQSKPSAVSLAHEPLYHRGIELYRAGQFFECHEVLEELWTPMRGRRRLFLQALIHFAVAFYHDQRGNPLGASRQLRKALRKIQGYLPAYVCIDIWRLYLVLLLAVASTEQGVALASYPEIHPVTPSCNMARM